MKHYTTVVLTAQDLLDLAKSKLEMKYAAPLNGNITLLGDGSHDYPNRDIRGQEEAVRIVFELPHK